MAWPEETIDYPHGRAGLRAVDKYPDRGPVDTRGRGRTLDKPADNVLLQLSIEELQQTQLDLVVIDQRLLSSTECLRAGMQPQIVPAWQSFRPEPLLMADEMLVDKTTEYHIMIPSTQNQDGIVNAAFQVRIEGGGDREQRAEGGPYSGMTERRSGGLVNHVITKAKMLRQFKITFRIIQPPVNHENHGQQAEAMQPAQPWTPKPPLVNVQSIQMHGELPSYSEWYDSVVIRIAQPGQARFVSIHVRILDMAQHLLPKDPAGFYQPVLYDIESVTTDKGNGIPCYQVNLKQWSQSIPPTPDLHGAGGSLLFGPGMA